MTAWNLIRSSLLVAVAGCAVLALRQAPRIFDPLRDSLAREEVQPIYSANLDDPWNRTFDLLFTRSVRADLLDERAPFKSDAPPLTGSPITRVESGDRATDPLYPSWTWMGSTAFDMSPETNWRILLDPRYAELHAALEALPGSVSARPPLARALMQADLWAAYDVLRVLHRPQPGRRTPADVLRADRAEALAPLLARAIGALALTRAEIVALPDNYAAAARSGGLPPVFDRNSGWLEARSFRWHEGIVQDRRVARVFIKPPTPPRNADEFLRSLREQHGGSESVDAVALVTQVLLVSADGEVVASPLTFDVQLRAREGARVRIDEYELSRQQLLAAPRTPGFRHEDEQAPAYLPMAGNDLSFATPFSLQGVPIVAPVRARCAACHGPGLGTLFIFSTKGEAHVEWQKPGDAPRAAEVAARKMASDDYRALREALTRR